MHRSVSILSALRASTRLNPEISKLLVVDQLGFFTREDTVEAFMGLPEEDDNVKGIQDNLQPL